MACAVTAWSPVIIRTSIPAPSAVCTASLASDRSGSMIPTIATNERSCANDMGSSVTASRSVSSMSRTANASTRRPFSPISSLAASMPARASSIGDLGSAQGAPWLEQRASTTSGPPLTSSINRSPSSTGIRWKVAMNLYSESNGTSARRG